MHLLRISNISNPAVREGVLCGSIFGILLLLISFIAKFDTNISTLLNYALIVGGYTYVGYRAAKTTKLLKTGAIAGSIAGSMTYFIYLIALFIVILINIESIRKGLLANPKATVADKTQYTNQYIIFALLFESLIQLLIVGTTAGALFGVFGGFIGKLSRSVAVAADSNEPANVIDTDATVGEIVPFQEETAIGEVEPSLEETTTEEVEPSQEETATGEVESSQEEIATEEVVPSQEEIATEEVVPSQEETAMEEVVPSQEEIATEEVSDTPLPASTTKKNYRKFLPH
jgi:hypothetical protein